MSVDVEAYIRPGRQIHHRVAYFVDCGVGRVHLEKEGSAETPNRPGGQDRVGTDLQLDPSGQTRSVYQHLSGGVQFEDLGIRHQGEKIRLGIQEESLIADLEEKVAVEFESGTTGRQQEIAVRPNAGVGSRFQFGIYIRPARGIHFQHQHCIQGEAGALQGAIRSQSGQLEPTGYRVESQPVDLYRFDDQFPVHAHLQEPDRTDFSQQQPVHGYFTAVFIDVCRNLALDEKPDHPSHGEAQGT